MEVFRPVRHHRPDIGEVGFDAALVCINQADRVFTRSARITQRQLRNACQPDQYSTLADGIKLLRPMMLDVIRKANPAMCRLLPPRLKGPWKGGIGERADGYAA
jgi:hypothetical protein